MNDSDTARLFEALHGDGKRPDAKTRENALRRLVFSEDGFILIKMLSPCLRHVYRPKESHALSFEEGRRSVLWDIIRTATGEEKE